MSHDGLGIAEARFWKLTPREFDALSQIYRHKLMRWGLERAMYANAHRTKDTPAWTPEDFVYGGREERVAALAVDKLKADMLTAQLAIAIPRPGVTPEGLPAWALGPYQGAN